MATKGEIVLHGIVILFFLTGLYDVLLNVEENECGMSHMYELPQYKKIPMSRAVARKYPRYGLYLYGEGHYFRVISDLKLEGIPVLYIPGNGGSMKQSRSVGSFLLRKAEKRGWDPHFNVFSVDLNEELIAFFGGTLNDQVEFVHHCIKTILKIYEKSKNSIKKPQSVVLVGHSMGGMVARGLFTSPGFDPKLVNVIYTLATPHFNPVFSIDMHIDQFYRSVNSYWEKNCEALKDVTLISISGGDRDFQVHGASTRLPACSNNSISTVSTAVPRAWVSADHQCAVWCKQIVLATTRSMNDMVDEETKQISSDASVRYDVIKYHFLHNPGLTEYPRKTSGNKVKLLTSHEVMTLSEPFWSSSSRESEAGLAYYMFDLVAMQENGRVLVVARTTTRADKWIMACNKENCKTGTDISKEGYLTPNFKVVKLNITELIQNGLTRLLFKVPKQTKYSGVVDVNFLSSEDLIQEYTVPHIFSNLWTLDQGYRMNLTIGNKAGKFYHRIKLSGLYSIFHAYKFTLQLINKKENDQPLMEVEFPEQPSYTYAKNKNVTVKLRKTVGTSVPTLHIYTDGSSEYEITVKVQFVQLLGQILRFHGSLIPTMLALNAMLAFSYQLKMLLAGKSSLSTVDAHGISAKPYKIQPFVNLVKALYGYEGFLIFWHKFGLPVPDAVRLDDEFRIWFGLLPLVVFLYGMELFLVSIYIQKRLIALFGALFRRITILKSAKDLEYSITSSAVHAVILAVLASQCGGMALTYICLLNFVDLCALSSIPMHDEVAKTEKNGNATISDTKEKSSATSLQKKEQNGGNTSGKGENVVETEMDTMSFNIKFSMHQLWLILASLSAPSVIARIKGYSFEAGDPTLAFAVFGSFLFLLHKQGDAVMKTSLSRRIICRFLYPLTILTSMLCLHSIHRLPYFILSFTSFYVAMQFFG